MSLTIDRAQLNLLGQDIKNNMPLFTLTKGLELFKQDRVQQLEVNNEIIRATVNGARITIDLNRLISNCACHSSFCSHLAAAFLYLNARYQWPDLFVAEFKQHQAEIKMPAQPPVEVTNQHVTVLPQGPVQEWTKFFAQEYQRITELFDRGFWGYDYDSYVYVSFRKVYQEFTQRIFKCCEDWPEKPRKLFSFHAILFILYQVEKLNQAEGNFTYQPFFDHCQNDLIEHLPVPLTLAEKEKYQPFLLAVRRVLHEFYFQDRETVFNWLLLYRIFWVSILSHPDWEAKELALLQKKNTPKSKHRYQVMLALAHFAVLQGQDQKARRYLDELDHVNPEDLFDYLYSFSQEEEWERLLDWLRWLAPVMPRVTQYVFSRICQLWTQTVRETGTKEEFITHLKAWLPRSYPAYGWMLLETARYREWAELHICYTNHPMQVDNEALRLVQTHDPAALLPLYHQWVARLIEGKNRSAYKEAVKYLKKLRTIYRKLKQLPQWESFIQILLARYPHRRALHEEIQKGKLVS